MTNYNFNTVTIGNQIWMAENLAIDDGGEGIYHSLETNEYYYTWDAAMRIANSIPGWHLPTTQEWNDVALSCNAIVDGYDPDLTGYKDAKNLYDTLGVKMVGYFSGTAKNVEDATCFWTSIDGTLGTTTAYYRQFNKDNSVHAHDSFKKTTAISVRLVQA